MDRLATLQDAIDRTKRATTAYTRTGTFEVHATDLLVSGDESRTGWIAGALERYLVTIADEHAAECGSRAGCRTCDAVGEALTACLSGLRWLQDGELASRVDGS